MKNLFQQILGWMIYSTAFKKWAGIIGGFAMGLWFSMNYHVQIRATLDTWGISKDAWANFLIAIAGACSVALSVALSVAKTKIEAKKENDSSQITLPPAP